jgi:hypothetical protein
MINQTNRELLIQQYIEGSLSEQDTKKFETLLKRDTTLKRDVALQREINANIEAAFDLQGVDSLLNEVVKDNKDFIKQTSKQAFKQKKRSRGLKNLVIILVIAGAAVSGGLWIASSQQKAATANKLATLPQHSVPDKDLPSKNTDVSALPNASTGNEETKAKTPNKPKTPAELNNDSKTNKTLKSPPALPPLLSQLDSLPEIIHEQGMGFGKAAGVRTKYRPVYFYNRLPEANKDHTGVYYQFRDTLRVYGQVTQRDRLFLLFKPQQGEYYMVTPKDTIPLAYKERKIRPLKK